MIMLIRQICRVWSLPDGHFYVAGFHNNIESWTRNVKP